MTSGQTRDIRSNSIWMMFEQICRLSVAMLLTAWMARSLGPHEMGRLSFSLSLCALLGIITTMGLNRIMVREFSVATDPNEESRLLGTALAMRFAASAAIAALAILLCLILSPADWLIVAILVPGFFFNAFDLVNLLYQSHLRSGTIVRCKLLAFAISSSIKAGLLAAGAGLHWLAFACLMDWVAAAIALAWLYYREHAPMASLRPAWPLALRLFKESRLEIVAGFSGLVFTRIDQVMLQVFHEPAQVALMAVSSRLTESWYFVPASLVASTFPIIVRLKAAAPEMATMRLRSLYRQVAWLGIAAAVGVTWFADEIISILYGVQYLEASRILVIQVWSGVFMSLGIASGSWLVAEGQVGKNMRRNMLGAAVNVSLNLWLIPTYGAIGAAWATLAALASAYLLFDFIDPATRRMGLEKLRAMLYWK